MRRDLTCLTDVLAVHEVEEKNQQNEYEARSLPPFYIVAGCIWVVSARFLFSLPVLMFGRKGYCRSGCSLQDQQTWIFCAWGQKDNTQDTSSHSFTGEIEFVPPHNMTLRTI